MKTWFEFPDSTRFGRTGRADILYTPIFFANEDITAKFCFDGDWNKIYDDFSQLEASARLIGKASLGFLSIGGQPARSIDPRYAIPSVGFRPIYTLTILDHSIRVELRNGDENRIPFKFRLPTSTLADLQQIASSLKVVTADTRSTTTLFQEFSPALIVSVQYALVGTVHHNGEKKSEHDSEIRIFVSLDQSQIPVPSPTLMGHNSLAELAQTGIISLGKTQSSNKNSRRRDSFPLLLRRLSRTGSYASEVETSSSMQGDGHLIVEAVNSEPFVFRTRDEAAAAKFVVTVTYHADSTPGEDEGNSHEPDGAPPPISANIEMMLKSHTSLTLEPLEPEEPDAGRESQDEYFHLRSKLLPGKKLKISFGQWSKRSVQLADNVLHQRDHQTEQHATSQSDASSRLGRSLPQSTRDGEVTNPDNNPSSRPASRPFNLLQQEMTLAEEQEQPPNMSTAELSNATRAYPSHLPTDTTAPPNPPPPAPSPPTMSIPTPPKRWTTTADIWLTHPITSTLTPSFTTPYINHMYTLSLSLSLICDTSSATFPYSPVKAKLFKSLKSGFGTSKKSNTVELIIPVQVRYDLGLVPSYEVDNSLPEYDFSLPDYDDAVGVRMGSRSFDVGAAGGYTGDRLTQDVNENNRSDDDDDVERRIVEGDAAYEARVSAPAPATTEATVRSTARTTTTSATPTMIDHRVPDNNLRNRPTSGTSSPSRIHQQHAWRHTETATRDSRAAIGEDTIDEDDDVLQMLMRTTTFRDDGGVATRRVYGYGDADEPRFTTSQVDRENT